MYIRTVNINRGGAKYGNYYQAVRSYPDSGKVKQQVVHLGQHSTAQSALEPWPREIQKLSRYRLKQAEKLQDKLNRLQELT